MSGEIDNLLKKNMGEILIVDDSKKNLKVLLRILEQEGYKVNLATNANEMFSYLEKYVPDLILLDVIMPGIDGYTACKKLKLEDVWNDIPVVLLAAQTETINIIDGFKCGAADFIPKPFEPLEVLIRVKTQIELKKTKEKLGELVKKEKRFKGIIEEQKKLLKNIAITDEVTNLVNKEYIIKEIKDEIARFRRTNVLFTLVECSIDNIKEVMELHGIGGSNHVLKELGEYFIEKKRIQDVVARWGEKEFLLLLPHTNLEGAQTFTERLRDEIEKSVIKYENRSINVTATFGVAEYNTNISYEEIVRRVEAALENGKNMGMNSVALDARYALNID